MDMFRHQELRVKELGEDKSNKLMSFHIDDEKILEKYKAIKHFTSLWR